MKTKIIILNLVFLFGLFVLPAWGQTSVFIIKVVSPPSTLPACKKVMKPDGSDEVYIPMSVTLELEESTPSPRRENGNYVFAAINCKTTATGYEITVLGSSQTCSTVSAPRTVSTPNPAPTVNPIPVIPKVSAKQLSDAKKEAFDMSIPESPGFTILGLTPQEVTRPTTPRQFATALINSIDRNGNFQSGIAIDTAPFQLLYGKNVERDEYIPLQEDKLTTGQNGEIIDKRKREPLDGFLTRFFWRTQFSLATTKGTTETDKSARLGAGLNFTFFDFGDLNTDFKLRDCQLAANREVTQLAYKTLGLTGPDDPKLDDDLELERKVDDLIDTLLESDIIQKKYQKCSEDAKKRNFGKSSFGVGVAGSWISKDGDSSKFINNGQGLWASLAYGFEHFKGTIRCDEVELKVEDNRCITPQLIFHYRRRVKETVPNPLVAGMFTTKDSKLFGTRLRIGVPKWSFNLEGVFSEERYAGRTSSHDWIGSFGADYKLADNLYLNFSIGGKTKESNIPNTGKVFVRTSFNWGTSQKPLAP